MMLVVGDEEGFIYVSKETYDQALILNDRFEGDMTLVGSKVSGTGSHDEAVEYFFNTAPEPINILAPFLNYVDDSVEFTANIEELCGALHQMSTVINFSEIVRVPVDVRSQVSFNKHFIKKYIANWESLESKLIVTDVDIENVKLSAVEELIKRVVPYLVPYNNTSVMAAAPVAQAVPVMQAMTYDQSILRESTILSDDNSTKVSDTGDSDLDDALSAAFDFFKEAEKEDEEKKKKQEELESASDITEAAKKIVQQAEESDTTLEGKDKQVEEANKIADLVMKFGGK